MLKQLGYSKSEIKCRGLIADHIEEYIIKQGKLTLDSSNMQQSIALIMVKSLLSLMNTDEYVLNVVLKNLFLNLPKRQ